MFGMRLRGTRIMGGGVVTESVFYIIKDIKSSGGVYLYNHSLCINSLGKVVCLLALM